MMASRAPALLVIPALLVLGGRLTRASAVLHLLAYCALLHALTHAEARLSDPLHPLLFVILGGAVAVVASTWHRPSGKASWPPARPGR